MNFNDNGTVSFQIGAKTYTLKVPTIGQIAEFEDLEQTLRQDAIDQLSTWNDELESADEGEQERIQGEIGNRNYAFTAINEPWLRKSFEAFGSDPLPGDLSDAPADLTSPSLLPSIIRHWRSDPLARSRRRQGRSSLN